MEVLTQLIGFVAMAFSVLSFQMNKHKRIMLMQLGAATFFALQYFMLGAYTGMALNMVSFFRDIVLYHRDKKWAQSPLWLVIFIALLIVFGILTWQGFPSLLMMVALVLNTFSFSFTKPSLVRSTILISSPMLLVYGILTGTIGGVINEIFAELSSIIGIIRYDIKRKS